MKDKNLTRKEIKDIIPKTDSEQTTYSVSSGFKELVNDLGIPVVGILTILSFAIGTVYFLETTSIESCAIKLGIAIIAALLCVIGLFLLFIVVGTPKNHDDSML